MSRLVYVVESFPERSQTFVQNELRELHLRGIVPDVVALYPPSDRDPTADGLDHVTLPSAVRSPARLVSALVRVGLRAPIPLLRAVGLAMARPSRLQLHALAKCVLLLDAVDRGEVRHLHAHFARVPASVAMLAGSALGMPFSFTAHASDFFVRPFDLDRKLRRARPCVTVCEYNRRWLRRQTDVDVDIALVECGVPVERFHRSGRTPAPAEERFVVSVGRLVPKKGYDDLIRAVAILRDRGVHARCRILGEGPERPRLERLVAELGVGDRVDLAGAISPDEVRDALESATVFCLPCVVAPDGDRDSQPVVIKEAMAMELPIVATDEVGIPEMVDDEVGRLVPPRDPGALAEALAEVLDLDDVARAAMGRAGRRRVEERYSMDELVGRLVDVFTAPA